MRWSPRTWRRHFALLPTRLEDGTVVWLETYWSRVIRNYRGVIVDVECIKEFPQ